MSRERALEMIKRGQRVFIGSGCGEPIHLVQGLIEKADQFHDLKLLHFLTLSDILAPEKKFVRRFRHNTIFIGPVTRQAINDARADYTPAFLSEVPEMFRQRLIPIDVALIQVSEPDKWGYVSLGVSVDITKPATECADIVIAQVNPRMPRTEGDTLIHISKLNAVVEYLNPVLEYDYPEPDEIVRKIAKRAARLVDDGDTIHVGYGQIPYATLDYLKDKKDLGVHTEVIGDRIIPLIESGAVSCEKKSLMPGKIVASFCIGTKKIYQYVDRNPLFQFMPADYVYNPAIIAQNDNLVSIGAALEVDLSGQVCSDSKGHFFYSGIGGRLDFVRGAGMSKNGRALLCLPSTTKDGKTSRIVHRLAEGAGVAATRGDIDYVVTEYGIVSLKGKSIRERAMALISIAHPDFRTELLEQAKSTGYIYPDQIIVGTGQDNYPNEVETKDVTPKGLNITIRPINSTDETLIQDFFYSHSEETIYKRYFRPVRAMPHNTAQALVNIDYKNNMAIVATTGQIGRDKIIGVVRYAAKPEEERAEVAYTIREEYQGQNLGSMLQIHMVKYARSVGLKGFKAIVLETNRGFINLFSKLGEFEKKKVEPGVIKLSIDFDRLNQDMDLATRPHREDYEPERKQ